MTRLFDTAGNAVGVWDTTGRLVFGTDTPGGDGERERPPPLDPVIAVLRPTGRVVFSATVHADGSGDFPTISAAVAAGKDEQARRVQADRMTAATPTTRSRSLSAPATTRTRSTRPSTRRSTAPGRGAP